MRIHLNALAILLLTLVFVSRVNAQTEKTKIDENFFGIVAGGTLSNISNYDADNRMGFVGGLYWEWRFSEKFSTMPSLLYAERGAKGLKLSYITIPIVLKYNFSEKFSIASGIAWDELVNVKSDDLKYSEARHDDWRIPVTLGYNLTNNLAVGISYSFGLSDITPDTAGKNNNNWGSLAVVYMFKKKKK